MKKDSLIITRETMLRRLLFILEKLTKIDNKLSTTIENKQVLLQNNKAI